MSKAAHPFGVGSQELHFVIRDNSLYDGLSNAVYNQHQINANATIAKFFNIELITKGKPVRTYCDIM